MTSVNTAIEQSMFNDEAVEAVGSLSEVIDIAYKMDHALFIRHYEDRSISIQGYPEDYWGCFGATPTTPLIDPAYAAWTIILRSPLDSSMNHEGYDDDC